MTIRVTSLASGSSGNALLVQSAQAALLVDCGLPQRAIERFLRHAGLCPNDLAEILPTGAMAEIAGFAVGSFAVPHDAADPVGYTIRTGGWCVGVALDLGSWDDAVLAA